MCLKQWGRHPRALTSGLALRYLHTSTRDDAIPALVYQGGAYKSVEKCIQHRPERKNSITECKADLCNQGQEHKTKQECLLKALFMESEASTCACSEKQCRREEAHLQVSAARAGELPWLGRPQVPGVVTESLLTTPPQGCLRGEDNSHHYLLPGSSRTKDSGFPFCRW